MDVAVIGAGAAGLVAARELIRSGHTVTIFERNHRVGGIWVYASETEADPLGQNGARIHGSLYHSLRTNLPRDLMAFSDYTFDSSGGGDDAWPRFPGHAEVLRYIENFAHSFDLYDCIRFGEQVESIEPGTGWTITSIAAGIRRHSHFDAVTVCNGHYSEPRVPALAGLSEWPGQLIHSHNYREPSPFQGKRIAVLGASASAVDLSMEIGRVAAALYWCAPAFATLPDVVRSNSFFQRRPNIEALQADGTIVLQDGAVLDGVEVLVFCTGYHYRFPFLDPALVHVDDNWVNPLYRDLLHVDHPTLAFIGLPFKVVPFPLFEVQARWFARLLAGDFHLPPAEQRAGEAAARVMALRAEGVAQRHFHRRQLDCYDYLDTLAEESRAPRLPEWHRQTTAALLSHVALHPGSYRDLPFTVYAPTRLQPDPPSTLQHRDQGTRRL